MTTKLTDRELRWLLKIADEEGWSERDLVRRAAEELTALRAGEPAPDANAPRCTLPGCRCIEEAKARTEADAWWASRPKCRCGRPTWRDVSGTFDGGTEVLRCVGPCGEARDRCKCDPVDPVAPPRSEAPPDAPDEREREYVVVQTVVETLAFGEVPPCECGKDAVCVGVAEGRLETLAVMCDDCCGHGNEDGWCVPLAAPRGDRLREAARDLSENNGITRDDGAFIEVRVCRAHWDALRAALSSGTPEGNDR